MIVKVAAATLLVGVSDTVPFLLHVSRDHTGDHDPADCHGAPDPLVLRTSGGLYVRAGTVAVLCARRGLSATIR